MFFDISAVSAKEWKILYRQAERSTKQVVGRKLQRCVYLCLDARETERIIFGCFETFDEEQSKLRGIQRNCTIQSLSLI